jgi:hypothetical protein
MLYLLFRTGCLSKVPFILRQVEPSPVQTPQVSFLAGESITKSQPTV